MGRLFWKIFLCVWLVQLAGMIGIGIIFSIEHRQREAQWHGNSRNAMPPPPPGTNLEQRPPAHEYGPGPGPGPDHEPGHEHRHDGPPPDHQRSPLPLVPALAALFSSLLCAALLAWYFAKPIRHLRNAFEAAAKGDLDVRIGASMGRRRDELADLGQDFDRMAERLSTLVDGQRRLLHDVSHELRSPLARLLAVIGLVRQQPERLDDMLLRMEREGGRINHLVGELLTLSRLEAGVINGSEAIDIAELLAGIVDDARFEAGERPLEQSGDADVCVFGNGELLHRAIENIVRNAVKHTPAGTPISIHSEVDRSDQRLRIVVADRGPGVADSQLEAIFTPFFRGNQPNQVLNNTDSHGLGLAIAQRVILACGGDIRASNRDGGGLQVTISLPTCPCADHG